MMDIDEVETRVTCLKRRVATLESKLDNANYILELVVEALKNPANSEMLGKVTKALMRERLGFLF